MEHNLYCVKCKKKTQNGGEIKIVKTKNGRKMKKVKCAICDIFKTQFTK